MGKVVFKVDEAFKAVVEQGMKNRCILFVKDHGVYLMAAAEPNKVCYAEGMNPEKDDFDVWYDAAHEACGGDDFGETYTDVATLHTFVKFCEAAEVVFELTESHISMIARG